MDSILTLRLDNKLEKLLSKTARISGRKKSDIARDAIKRQLDLMAFDHIRQKLLPLAEKQGVFSDEDVFNMVS